MRQSGIVVLKMLLPLLLLGALFSQAVRTAAAGGEGRGAQPRGGVATDPGAGRGDPRGRLRSGVVPRHLATAVDGAEGPHLPRPREQVWLEGGGPSSGATLILTPDTDRRAVAEALASGSPTRPESPK